MKIRRSTGNVFRDLGFSDEEATNLKMRTDLMIRLSKLIEARSMTQAEAANSSASHSPESVILFAGRSIDSASMH